MATRLSLVETLLTWANLSRIVLSHLHLHTNFPNFPPFWKVLASVGANDRRRAAIARTPTTFVTFMVILKLGASRKADIALVNT